MKRLMAYIISGLCAVFLLVACTDELFNDGDGKGETLVSASVNFSAYTSALETRSAGNAIKEIKTLWIVIYDANGNFVEKREITGFTSSITSKEHPDGITSAESATGHAEFQMRLPNGKYKIYAVANCDEISSADVSTEDALKSISLSWNASDVKENSEMFGYFHESDNNTAEGFDAQIITISPSTSQLHAWVKRAASKLTVAFDTRNLKENIYIYVKSVAVKDISKNCLLGKSNTPDDATELIKTGEVFYFGGAKASHTDAKANHANWRMINKGTGIWGYNSEKNGALDSDDYDAMKKYEHGENVQALYFYENMQGEGTSGTMTDKRQDVYDDDESKISFPEGVNEDNAAWKDAKRFGSYVEVEAYYISENVKRLGEGPIKYRFMLGKDTHIDYNAERNYHYKLTLCFNGYANDIDWHIDYDEEHTPGLFTPDTTYVSYYYNVEQDVAVRATPKPGYKLDYLEAVITNNEWIPYNPNGSSTVYNTKAWTMQNNQTDSYSGGKQRAKTAYGDNTGIAPNCEFGFLSLCYDKTVNVEPSFNAGSSSVSATQIVNFLRDYYYKKRTGVSGSSVCYPGKRTYNSKPSTETANGTSYGTTADGRYTVYLNTTTDGSVSYKNYTYVIPLYTRPKSMMTWSAYTGANPFFKDYRKARIKFVAHYVSETNASDTYTDVGYTTVLQAKRIENPMAVLRSYANKESFHINLKARDSSTSYSSIVSHGPWSATIESDPNGIVKLTKGSQTVTGVGKMIEGVTGTEIDFTYTPNKTATSSTSYGAIILVRYHNNDCTHRILVRQGYSPIKLGSATWTSYNVYSASDLTVSPLSVGSMFCSDNDFSNAIAESNNTRSGYGVGGVSTSNRKFNLVDGSSKYWTTLSSDMSYNIFQNYNTSYRLPTLAEVNSLLNNSEFAYGIAYSDGATGVQSTANAYNFSDTKNNITSSPKGVRGIMAYSLSTGNNVFFPIGATGHARRKDNYWATTSTTSLAYGVLHYGTLDVRVGGYDGMGPNGKNNYRPMAYDLNNQFGAIYWLYNSGYTGNSTDIVAFDFNYDTYGSGLLSDDNVFLGSGSSALPVRLVKR